MPMRCYFLTRQVTIKFWPVYKSRSIFWTGFEDLKGRLIHRKIRYIKCHLGPYSMHPCNSTVHSFHSFNKPVLCLGQNIFLFLSILLFGCQFMYNFCKCMGI